MDVPQRGNVHGLRRHTELAFQSLPFEKRGWMFQEKRPSFTVRAPRAYSGTSWTVVIWRIRSSQRALPSESGSLEI